MREKLKILLVEDDQVDAMTVVRAFKEINSTNEVKHIDNAEEALKYLKEPGTEMPAFILLDLNMPRMNGIEFLEIIKNDDDIKHIPAVVLTTSAEEYDRKISFQNGVAGYMVKPIDYQQFVNIIHTISNYWATSELP